MQNTLPKVLHPVAGQPMLHYVVHACKQAECSEIRLIVGYGQGLVEQVAVPWGLSTFVQNQQLGTAHAVMSASYETFEGDIFIVAGDHPLLTAGDIKEFYRVYNEEKMDLCIVTCELKHPKEFGRIVRSSGQIRAIVEAKDASAETLKIKEVNTSIYFVKADLLKELLPKIKNHNSKGEYYLTEIVSLALEYNYKVGSVKANSRVAFGVNTQDELSQATSHIYKMKSKALLNSGVLMLDPKTAYIEPTVQIGSGSVIYPNVFIKGDTAIGSFAMIESNCFINNSEIGDGTMIKAGSYIEEAKIAEKCSVGPFARIRPGSELASEVHIGNFVELKKAKMGKKAKAGHLSYLGDCEIGQETNIGCGTITCNYAVDRKKYKTQIGDRVFVGSDSQFVAPVKVGDDAIIGSGSTITKDVPAKALAVARGKQFIKENYSDKLNSSKDSDKEA
jgi:bifunctional UDP-N-acetylglucosamine pyrophosphorylase/glucosamine-1-phosphate N-acetyltransferase